MWVFTHGGTDDNSGAIHLDKDMTIKLISSLSEWLADVHGGCPPAIRAIHRHGVTEAQQAIKAYLAQEKAKARLDELRHFHPDDNWYGDDGIKSVSDRIAKLLDKENIWATI